MGNRAAKRARASVVLESLDATGGTMRRGSIYRLQTLQSLRHRGPYAFSAIRSSLLSASFSPPSLSLRFSCPCSGPAADQPDHSQPLRHYSDSLPGIQNAGSACLGCNALVPREEQCAEVQSNRRQDIHRSTAAEIVDEDCAVARFSNRKGGRLIGMSGASGHPAVRASAANAFETRKQSIGVFTVCPLAMLGACRRQSCAAVGAIASLSFLRRIVDNALPSQTESR